MVRFLLLSLLLLLSLCVVVEVVIPCLPWTMLLSFVVVVEVAVRFLGRPIRVDQKRLISPKERWESATHLMMIMKMLMVVVPLSSAIMVVYQYW